jgi:hypothetical protein
MDHQPIKDRLNPFIVFGNAAIPDESTELVDNPLTSGVDSLDSISKEPDSSLQSE